jgi:hypothetical protein
LIARGRYFKIVLKTELEPADWMTADVGKNRRLYVKKFFWSGVPDLPSSSRNDTEESISPEVKNLGDLNAARADKRLRILNSLSFSHQRYLFQEIAIRCSRYLRRNGISNSEVTMEEMLSEVWKKLLSSISVQDEGTAQRLEVLNVDVNSPELDGRVSWLIEEIGGSEALAHRHEDILRQRWGRFMPNRGRPVVQPDDDEEFETLGASEPPTEVNEVARLAWFGLLQLAERNFPQKDDVSILLHLLNDARDLFDEAATGKWPINEIVLRLNTLFPNADWRVDRVDNAKRRLTRWVDRLKQINGLDQTDLEALLVRVARGSDRPLSGEARDNTKSLS